MPAGPEPSVLSPPGWCTRCSPAGLPARSDPVDCRCSGPGAVRQRSCCFFLCLEELLDDGLTGQVLDDQFLHLLGHVPMTEHGYHVIVDVIEHQVAVAFSYTFKAHANGINIMKSLVVFPTGVLTGGHPDHDWATVLYAVAVAGT